jgi:hypothetical protein
MSEPAPDALGNAAPHRQASVDPRAIDAEQQPDEFRVWHAIDNF